MDEERGASYTFTIKVDKRKFTIASNVDEKEYVDKVVSYLNKEIEKIREEAPYDSFERVLLLATLNIIDKLFKKEEEIKKFEYIMDKIIDRISNVT